MLRESRWRRAGAEGAAGPGAAHAFGFIGQHEQIAVHQRQGGDEQGGHAHALQHAQNFTERGGVGDQDHREQAQDAFQGDPQAVGAGGRLEGVDQGHAQHKRGQHEQPPQQKEGRQPAQSGHQQQEQSDANEPAHAPHRQQHGAENDRERAAEFGHRRPTVHRAGVRMRMAQPVGIHGGGKLSPGVRFGTSQRPSSRARPNTMTAPMTPASAVAPTAQCRPGI